MLNERLLAEALREARLLINQTRRTRRAWKRLEDASRIRVLESYHLAPGEQISGEVIDFLRLAAAEHEQGVSLLITAREGTERTQA